jgi:hypothetical protein
MKINIGGGYKKYDGFVNVDNNEQSKPDYVVDLETDVLPFEDSSVSEVKAYHILEHLGDGFFHLMIELYRVCENQAIIDIQVPHHRHEVFFGDATHVRTLTVEMMRQFSKKQNQFELDMWRHGSLFGLQYDIDFEIIQFNFKPDDVWLQRFPTMSREEIEEVSRNFNNVYTETHIKMLVIK